MSNPFNSSSQNFSRQNAALGHQRNVDANHRAMQNHQAHRSGGGGGGIGGLLAVVFLILVVLVVIGALG
jgi:hypothetical protein